MLALAYEMTLLGAEPHVRFAPYLTGAHAIRFDIEVHRAARKHLKDQVTRMLEGSKNADDLGIGLILQMLAAQFVRG